MNYKFGWFSIAESFQAIPQKIEISEFANIANLNTDLKQVISFAKLSEREKHLLQRCPAPSTSELLKLRHSNNYKQAKERLKPNLSVIYPAGIFNHSKELNSIISLSGFCAIDIDIHEKNEPLRYEIKDILSRIPCVKLISNSIGFGVWCLVQFEFDTNPLQVQDIKKIDLKSLFKEVYSVFISICSEHSIDVSLIDRQAEKATQARFIADCVSMNFETTPLQIELDKFIISEPQYNYLPPAPRDTSNLFIDILEKISHLDLIHTNHTWNNFAAFLKGCLGENGRYYFHKISSNNIKYSPEASEKKFNQVKPFHAKNPLNVLISYIPQHLFNLKDYLNEKNRAK